MTLPLTPDMLAGAYEYLRTTPPFKGWRLPDADEVGFEVVVSKPYQGAFTFLENAGTPIIQISAAHVGHTIRLMTVLAHEMCHMRLWQRKKLHTHHGKDFQRLAGQVCRFHGFDPKEF